MSKLLELSKIIKFSMDNNMIHIVDPYFKSNVEGSLESIWKKYISEDIQKNMGSHLFHTFCDGLLEESIKMFEEGKSEEDVLKMFEENIK